MTPEPTKTLSIIIVSFNTENILRECLKRVRLAAQDIDLETIVIDNGSRDDSVKMMRTEFPEVTLICQGNRGFAGGNNPGFRRAAGKYILLLNSDAYLFEDTLQRSLEYMHDRPQCGIMGISNVSEDGSSQPSARQLPSPWKKLLVISGIAARFPKSRILGGPDYSWWDHAEAKSVGWVPGSFFLIRREVVDQIGYLDERYFMYFEEVDFCLQAQRRGWTVDFSPATKVIHLGGQSSMTTNKRVTASGKQLLNIRLESEYRFYRKNYGLPSVLAAAGVEILWKSMVYAKNSLFPGDNAEINKADAEIVMREIWKTLREDNLGKGIVPKACKSLA